MMIYRYFSPFRPVSPGTFPNAETLVEIHNFDNRKFIKSAGCEVWGYIDYSEPLTKGQIDDYELIGEGQTDEFSFEISRSKKQISKMDFTIHS